MRIPDGPPASPGDELIGRPAWEGGRRPSPSDLSGQRRKVSCERSGGSMRTYGTRLYPNVRGSILHARSPGKRFDSH